jgi:hypothetical protein
MNKILERGQVLNSLEYRKMLLTFDYIVCRAIKNLATLFKRLRYVPARDHMYHVTAPAHRGSTAVVLRSRLRLHLDFRWLMVRWDSEPRHGQRHRGQGRGPGGRGRGPQHFYKFILGERIQRHKKKLIKLWSFWCSILDDVVTAQTSSNMFHCVLQHVTTSCSCSHYFQQNSLSFNRGTISFYGPHKQLYSIVPKLMSLRQSEVNPFNKTSP